MSRVLVTGASGFVGRHCIAPLLKAGFEVHCVSRTPHPDADATWHRADLLAMGEIGALLARVRPSHILHLAWDVRPGVYWTSIDNYQWVRASLELLEAFAVNGGQRACMVGTCAEYDWSTGPCTEFQTPCRPATPYGICKYALSTMLDSFARQFSLSATWPRLFYMYGPFEKPARLLPTAILTLVAGQPLACTDGNQIRDFLCVEDVASALVALLTSDVTGPVNVASGAPIAIKDMVLMVGRQLKREHLIQLGALPTAPDDPPMISATVQRLAHEVGWAPHYALEAGIARSISWWREQLGEPIQVTDAS